MRPLSSRVAASVLSFARSSAGAVTSDMVPLIAAGALLGLAVVGTVAPGLREAAGASFTGMAGVIVGQGLPGGESATSEGDADAGDGDAPKKAVDAPVVDAGVDAPAPTPVLPAPPLSEAPGTPPKVTWAVPTKTLSPGWGPEVNSPWLDPSRFRVAMPATFEVIGDGNPRAQMSNGQMATKGVFEWGTILKLDTPACGRSSTVYLRLNGGEEVVSYTVSRPEWPSNWGARPAGC